MGVLVSRRDLEMSNQLLETLLKRSKTNVTGEESLALTDMIRWLANINVRIADDLKPEKKVNSIKQDEAPAQVAAPVPVASGETAQ